MIQIEPISLCIGAVLGGFALYTIMKLRILEYNIKDFPSAEELAKQVMKIKIPIDAIPEEMLDKFNQKFKIPPIPQNKPPSQEVLDKLKANYIG